MLSGLRGAVYGFIQPSCKLTATWARWEDDPTIGAFGEKNEARYREGIYVGYRYFDSFGATPLFPFGYGLSYTEFPLRAPHAVLEGTAVTITASVQNLGAFPGKEVVQLSASLPAGYILEAGDYLLRYGSSSRDTEVCAAVRLDDGAVTKKQLQINATRARRLANSLCK